MLQSALTSENTYPPEESSSMSIFKRLEHDLGHGHIAPVPPSSRMPHISGSPSTPPKAKAKDRYMFDLSIENEYAGVSMEPPIVKLQHNLKKKSRTHARPRLPPSFNNRFNLLLDLYSTQNSSKDEE
jgi:hypothetical protein